MKTPQVEDGYLRIANSIAKYLAQTYMSSYESQILWVVFLKTYGYNKKEDWISNSQFAELTGMRKGHISRTIKKLVNRKIVTQTGNKIAFQKDSRLWLKLPKQVTVTQTGNSVTHLGPTVTHLGPKLPKQVTTIDNIQKTITKDNLQKTFIFTKIENLRNSDLQELADLYKVPVSYVESKKDDLAKYCEAKGTTYKNYKAALSLWIKNDVKAGKAPVKVVKTYPDDEIRKKYPNF
jgi:phage replication O-like protein O